jgi:hypothetical protein
MFIQASAIWRLPGIEYEQGHRLPPLEAGSGHVAPGLADFAAGGAMIS